MKKLMILVVFTSMGILFSQNAYAAEFREPTQVEDNVEKEEWIDGLFQDIDPSDKVIVLPDGGWLHGEATVTYEDAKGESVVELNSETDKNAVTVEVVKEVLTDKLEKGELTTNNNNPMLRGASVPKAEYTLKMMASYESNIFAVDGWLFSGYRFSPAANTGAYLRWVSHGDSGMVGRSTDAASTLNGRLSGRLLNANTYTYVEGSHMIYYSYNTRLTRPRYQVANI